MPIKGYKSITVTQSDHARLLKLKDQMSKEFGIKITIGQALSYLISQHTLRGRIKRPNQK
jgi:hypothetical protein